MEQWVRVRNEQDRQLLKRLIEAVGETEIVKAVRACARSLRGRTICHPNGWGKRC